VNNKTYTVTGLDVVCLRQHSILSLLCLVIFRPASEIMTNVKKKHTTLPKARNPAAYIL
jgi:hypothetical protein